MSGHKVFVTSFSSCLRPYCAEQVKEQPLDGAWQEGPVQPVCPQASVQLSSLLELRYEDKRPVLTKESKILSYVVGSCPPSSPFLALKDPILQEGPWTPFALWALMSSGVQPPLYCGAFCKLTAFLLILVPGNHHPSTKCPGWPL